MNTIVIQLYIRAFDSIHAYTNMTMHIVYSCIFYLHACNIFKHIVMHIINIFIVYIFMLN